MNFVKFPGLFVISTHYLIILEVILYLLVEIFDVLDKAWLTELVFEVSFFLLVIAFVLFICKEKFLIADEFV